MKQKLMLLLWTWKGRRAQKRYGISNKDILKIFKGAKSGKVNFGLCYAIRTSRIDLTLLTSEQFKQSCPFFCSEFLTGKYKPDGSYWWDKEDINSRFEALDKLITLYSADKIVISILGIKFKF